VVTILLSALGLLMTPVWATAWSADSAPSKQVVILGIDGMDPVLLKTYVDEGRMPNFSKLMARGGFSALETSVVPQSPVAWSTFITGMDPGGHGIFDFLHRDPETMLPFLSMAKATPASEAGVTISLGDWVLPLASGRTELLRKGRPFWQLLGENGVATTIFRMPVNFPPAEIPLSRQISGMGTPDIRGTSGTFSYYTERLPDNAPEFTGGRAYRVRVVDGTVRGTLYGPDNPFRRSPDQGRRQGASPAACTLDFTVYLDTAASAANFRVGDREFILREGEWSAWVPIRFEAVPWLVDFHAVGRFFLKRIRPPFELYVSPLQVSLVDPVMPISSPPEWSRHLCSCAGYFHTQEMPEETKAFRYGVLSGREFWDQAMFVYAETERVLRCLLDEYEEGLLFLYVGTIDQASHMLWHYADVRHPAYQLDEFLSAGIRKTYEAVDDMLGTVTAALPADAVIIVMSDHGFAPFYRSVNLNTWLLENGYVALKDPSRQGQYVLFGNVDWSRTSAYALGLNSLYVNLRGREREGTVTAGEEYEALLERLEADLRALVDPVNGGAVVSAVTRPDRAFHGPHKSAGADLIVGYGRGYRSSWESPIGEFSATVFEDNESAWSGDHCIDHRLVPGVLVTNRKISLAAPSLEDLTVAVLDEYGVPPTTQMRGRDCLAPPASASR
jgi:predicted AlkP superfamily phosphohydrolase/phosphomutase